MTVSRVEQKNEGEWLDGVPEYERLSKDEKNVILHRLLKVNGSHFWPERGPAIQAEVDAILKELRATPSK
jgi:hypothetical protein